MTAFKIQNLFKSFKIPHDRRDSLRENIFNLFSRNNYEVFNAVDNLSFQIKKGEFFGVIGKNGSGKSTLLKMLAGIYIPSSGEIITDGKIVPFLELGVGFNSELTGRENVFLNATILGLSEQEIEEKYDEIVAFSELERFMDQKLKNYSSGMYVRLAFSVAMQVNADIFLMDEVLAVGDVSFQLKCFEKFRELKNEGKTIVFVTHDLGSVRQYCDRVLYLKNGGEVILGNVDDVIDKYIYEDNELEVEKDFEKTDLEYDVLKVDEPKNVEILDVIMLDKCKKLIKNILSGDPMTIRVKYKLKQNIKDIVVGIGIYDENGKYVYGTNSYLQKKELKLSDIGFIDIYTEELPLIYGKYFLTVAFHSAKGEPYHWIEKGYSFNVFSRSHHAGVFDLDFKIML